MRQPYKWTQSSHFITALIVIMMVWWCVQANLIVVARCVFIHHKGVIIAGWRRHSVMIYIETDRWSQTVRYWWDIECQHISGISNKVSDSPWSLWLSIYWLCIDICWNQNKFESHKRLSQALHALVWLTLWLWPRVWGLCCNCLLLQRVSNSSWEISKLNLEINCQHTLAGEIINNMTGVDW